MSDYGSYGGYSAASPTDMIAQTSEIISLVLITLSFIVLAYLAYRVKTVRSIQFEMFIFGLALFVAEVPRILETIGLVTLTGLESSGLVIHTISMILLSAFISLRVYNYFRGK